LWALPRHHHPSGAGNPPTSEEISGILTVQRCLRQRIAQFSRPADPLSGHPHDLGENQARGGITGSPFFPDGEWQGAFFAHFPEPVNSTVLSGYNRVFSKNNQL